MGLIGGGDSGGGRPSNVDIRPEEALSTCCGSPIPPVPNISIPRKTAAISSMTSSAMYSVDITNVFLGRVLNSSRSLEKSNLNIELFRCEGLVALIATDFWKSWDSFQLERTRNQVWMILDRVPHRKVVSRAKILQESRTLLNFERNIMDYP